MFMKKLMLADKRLALLGQKCPLSYSTDFKDSFAIICSWRLINTDKAFPSLNIQNQLIQMQSVRILAKYIFSQGVVKTVRDGVQNPGQARMA